MARENFKGLAKIHNHETKPKGGPTSPAGPQYGPIRSPHAATANRGEFVPQPAKFHDRMRPQPVLRTDHVPGNPNVNWPKRVPEVSAPANVPATAEGLD